MEKEKLESGEGTIVKLYEQSQWMCTKWRHGSMTIVGVWTIWDMEVSDLRTTK